MPLDTGFRSVFYGVVALLFATGAGWLAFDTLQESPGAWAETTTVLLMVHGGAAMAMLLLLGALLARHIEPSWHYGRNRASGTAMVALNALLVVTAFGLYYLGAERWRAWTSDLHIVVGLALPLLLLLHVALGKRSSARRMLKVAQSAPLWPGRVKARSRPTASSGNRAKTRSWTRQARS